MGPRSSDRGNLRLAEECLSNAGVLQWGRDHLIAEMGVLARDFLEGRRLQWGRDHLIAEIRDSSRESSAGYARLQWGRDHLIAEMQKRRRRRHGSFASMGPRSSDRGNAGWSGGFPPWGFRFNGAAII